MSIFEVVKQSVSTRQAAEFYGIPVRKNGMCVCPFHDDRNPSMKVDRRFHCFGCQADGDVIDFAARLFDLNLKEAALKLAADFSVRLDGKGYNPSRRKPAKPKICEEQHCFQVLSYYRRLLAKWKTEYAPKQPDEDWNPLFVEALQIQDYIDYLLDELLSPNLEERAALVAEYGKEVRKIEQRIAGLSTDSFLHRGGSAEQSGTDRERENIQLCGELHACFAA